MNLKTTINDYIVQIREKVSKVWEKVMKRVAYKAHTMLQYIFALFSI
jgi:hypothetical protein